LIISVVFVINAIKTIESERKIIEIIILKKREKYVKYEIDEVLNIALR